MRRILVDHARRRLAGKRGGEAVRLQLDENLAEPAAPGTSLDLDLLALDRALTELEALDPRLVRLVELRFFGGLSLEEMTEEMQLSRATVTREWAFAKTWLQQRLGAEAAG
jgi:RNA polymerase sigma factor (TIGR02999 family)